MFKIIYTAVAMILSAVSDIQSIVMSIVTKLNTDLDTKISSRQASWGATTAHRDRIDANISSRQASWGATTTHSARIDANISTRADQATVNAIKAKTDLIQSGVVKSVQRGVIEPDSSNEYKYININAVNPAKSSITLYGAPENWNYGDVPAYVVDLSSTQLVIYSAGRYDRRSSWQIVEFY